MPTRQRRHPRKRRNEPAHAAPTDTPPATSTSTPSAAFTLPVRGVHRLTRAAASWRIGAPRRLCSRRFARKRGTHYDAIAREEIERADIARAEFFVAADAFRFDVAMCAPSWNCSVIERNRESSRQPSSDQPRPISTAISREYVVRHPPESLPFDPASFQGQSTFVAFCTRRSADRTERPERLEASQRLEALLAFTLRVDG